MFYRMPAAAPSFTSPPFLHLPLRHLSTVSPSSPPSPLYPLSIFLPPSPSFSPLLHLPPPFTIFLAPSPLPLEPHPHHLSSHLSQSLSEPPPPQSDSAHLSQSENISWQSVNSGSAISLKQKGFLLARRFPPMKSTFH